MEHSYASVVSRTADLLIRGPAPTPQSSHGRTTRLRRAGRDLALRLIRPYTTYQRQVDVALLDAVRIQARQAPALWERSDVLQERSETLEMLTDDLVVALGAMRQRIAALEQDLSGSDGRSLRAEIDTLKAALDVVPYTDGTPFRSLDTPVGEALGFERFRPDRPDQSSYEGFEAVFRGPAERVRTLQLPYLPLVRDHAPVLDVGCGRGEFLELLSEHGIAARGVDADPGMVERCRQQGFSVELGDAIEYLDAVADASLGTVFCAQVIEHLPPPVLLRFLDTARRKLRPGGLLIAETVNPHNVSALKTFWVDITHQHPLFPETVLALSGLSGFHPAYVFAPGHDSFAAARTASTTYALVATAPEA